MTASAAIVRREERDNQERFKVQNVPLSVGGCDEAWRPDRKGGRMELAIKKRVRRRTIVIFLVYAVFI